MQRNIKKLRSFLGHYKELIKNTKLRKYLLHHYNHYDVSLLKKTDDTIKFIQQCITDATKEVSKLALPEGDPILDIHGMSSDKNRHLLNNICSLKNARYLEVGVWQGSTFISAGYKNILNMVAIDNWSQFDGPSDNFIENCKKYINNNKFKQYDQDAFSINPESLGKSFNIYFYDGDHSYDAQYKAFTHFNPILDNTFIAIVDDFNAKDVQEGTYDAFKKLNYNILFEQKLLTPANSDTSSWWNGIYIGLIQKKEI